MHPAMFTDYILKNYCFLNITARVKQLQVTQTNCRCKAQFLQRVKMIPINKHYCWNLSNAAQKLPVLKKKKK